MSFPIFSLLLYKKRPARLVKTGEKLEIELDDGNLARVRPKDVVLLHPGPLARLADLIAPPGEVELAWEMLAAEADTPHSLQELAELAYGAFTPATAWAAWELVEDGLYFHGTPEAILAHSAAETAAQQAARQARRAEAQAWNAFLERARRGQIDPAQDGPRLREVEELAYARRDSSRLLSELGRSSRPEAAQAFLLETGAWSAAVNPHPLRLGLPVHTPQIDLPPLPQEERLDLTGLAAYAIDDRENKDPDDAVSLERIEVDSSGKLVGGKLWVHVADVAALVSSDSPADREARQRGATLYLPEGAVQLLPAQAIQVLGLGLQQVSPALSFGLEIDGGGEIGAVAIRPTWVRVQRLSYEQADEWMEEESGDYATLAGLMRLAQAYLKRRQAHGALTIDLPEAMLHVIDGEVHIRPVLRGPARMLVREAMLMAGEAAARFAIQHAIPFPYATQDKPDAPLPQLAETDLAGQFALRRTLKRGQVHSHPGIHAGVGLEAYSRATSPLRRYLDLVVHQQLRAFISGATPLDEQAMLERLAAAEAAVSSVNRAEALSRRHWTLVYFLQHPGWQGQGVLVEKQGLRGKLIIPELAFETAVHLRQDAPLNSRIGLAFKSADLAELEASFSITG